MKSIERVSEHDDKERGLIAFRLNDRPFNCSAAKTYRQHEIILVKPFNANSEPMQLGAHYINMVNDEHMFIDEFCKKRPTDTECWFSILISGYEDTTPLDQVEVIGEVIKVKDDRPSKVIQSGFVKGNPSMRLNYQCKDDHYQKHHRMFVNVCQGKEEIEEGIISIFRNTIKGE